MNVKTVLDRLADHFGVTEDGRPALSARVKQLQRLGWPASTTNVPRGKRDNWSEDAYVDVLLASELRSLGLTAQTAVEMVKQNYDALRSAFANRAKVEISRCPFSHPATKSRIVIDFTL